MHGTRLLLGIFAMVLSASVLKAQVTSGPGYTNIVFDGATNYINVPADVSAIAGKSFSIEAWVNGSTTEGGNYIVSRFNSSIENPTDEQNDFSLQINSQGHVILALGGSAGPGFILISNKTLTPNQWYHVAFSIEYIDLNSAPYRATLYVDDYSSGSLVRETITQLWYGPAYTRTVLLSEPITIGKYANDQIEGGYFFSGQIDEVRIWQGARSGSDIKSFAFVSISKWSDATWSLTASQAGNGTSRNLLAASYNFNSLIAGDSARPAYANPHYRVRNATDAPSTSDGPIVIRDDSKYENNATLNGDLVLGITNLPFYQYIQVAGEVPTFIPLYGLKDGVISTGVSFVVSWTESEIGGQVFSNDPFDNVTTALIDPLRPYDLRNNIPGLGAQLSTGSTPSLQYANGIVYVLLSTSVITRSRLRYYAVANGVQSAVTEVRINIQCAGNRSSIDECGVCGGDNSTCTQCVYDLCGECNGNNTCLGCDGEPWSGLEIDLCGVCGGINACIGCDHMGGGVVDACGVCNGDNSTCSNTTVDACGVLGGDGSSCTCVRYHGYHVQELDYLILRWGFTNSVQNINELLSELSESLSLLENYDGELDLAAVVKYINNFETEYLDDYETEIDTFVQELDVALGLTVS